jgi:hypothetical protein
MQCRTQFLLLLFLLNASVLFSQTITLSELVNLKDLEIVTAKKYFESKQWKIGSENKQTDHYNEVIFFYEDDTTVAETQKIISFIYATNKEYPNRLNAQIGKIEFDVYLSQMKLLAFKFITSSIEEGLKVDIFQNKTTTIMTSQPIDKTSPNLFYLFLYDNADYFRNIRKETNIFKKS